MLEIIALVIAILALGYAVVLKLGQKVLVQTITEQQNAIKALERRLDAQDQRISDVERIVEDLASKPAQPSNPAQALLGNSPWAAILSVGINVFAAYLKKKSAQPKESVKGLPRSSEESATPKTKKA